MSGPGWPDVRGWAIIGAFIIIMTILAMIWSTPGLLKDASFMSFIGVLTGGTVLTVYSNLFGGTKSGAETNSAIAANMAKVGEKGDDK